MPFMNHMYQSVIVCVATFTLHTMWFVVYRCVFAVLYLHQCFVLHNSVHIVQLSCSVGSAAGGG